MPITALPVAMTPEAGWSLHDGSLCDTLDNLIQVLKREGEDDP